MTPIRPNAPPTYAASGLAPGATAAREAAQRAFFDAAMGRAAAPARPAAAAQPAQAAPSISAAGTTGPSRVQPAAEASAKLPRPGSLFDIRV